MHAASGVQAHFESHIFYLCRAMCHLPSHTSDDSETFCVSLEITFVPTPQRHQKYINDVKNTWDFQFRIISPFWLSPSVQQRSSANTTSKLSWRCCAPISYYFFYELKLFHDAPSTLLSNHVDASFHCFTVSTCDPTLCIIVQVKMPRTCFCCL